MELHSIKTRCSTEASTSNRDLVKDITRTITQTAYGSWRALQALQKEATVGQMGKQSASAASLAAEKALY